MSSPTLRSSRPLLVLAALVVAIVAFGSLNPAWTDDTELLRFSTQSPYLMILLDTSRSMNQAIASDTPLPGGGDNPDSRIYAAKQALFSVFRNVSDVNFGFMTLDQDTAHVRGKHWLYYTRALPSGYPAVGWPTVAAAGQDPMVVTVGSDGLPDPNTNSNFTDSGAANGNPSDLVTFGSMMKDGSGNPIVTAGTCASPLDLTDMTVGNDAKGRMALDVFPKTGTDSSGNPLATTLWVVNKSKNVYRLTVTRAATDVFGSNPLPIQIAADLVTNCSAPPAVGTAYAFSFITQANVLDDYLFDDNGAGGDANGADPSPQYWSWKDPLSSFNCANPHPFTGYGGEGNYDSGIKPSDQGITDTAFETALTSQANFNADPFCIAPGDCIYVKPMLQTTYDKRGRPLDRGDFLPWDWLNDNKAEFLHRLAPNWNGSNNPDFGVAGYFADFAADTAGDRRLKNAAQIPLIATGETALAMALTDLRCWYMGTANESGNSGKCGASPFGNDFAGWRNIACNQDTGDKNYGCRKPYFIVISDGDADSNSCQVQNPTASVSDLNSFSGIQTWYLMVGPTKNNKGCNGTGIGNALTNAGKGQCVVINSKQDLLNTIQNILGIIREQTRAFASAAVPTVQATADQSIFVSNFTPLQSSAIWDGHVNAFIKPLPLANGKPDTTVVCSATLTSGCFLWDAGKVLTSTQYNATTPTDWHSSTQRRIYYPSLWQSDGTTSYAGHWVTGAQLLQKATPNVTNSNIQFDLWAGFGLIGSSSMPAGSANASTWDQTRCTANTAITGPAPATCTPAPAVSIANPIELMKTALVTGETTPRQFLLGDVFHSDPVVIGSPVDLRYYAQNVGSDKNTANATCSAGMKASDSNADHGYRCFFNRHQYRRKVLVIGHNDGMLHAFNAGIFDQNANNTATGTKGKFTDGTGNELFGFMPRSVMPTAFRTTLTGATHAFSVDGSPVAADVFIDPIFDNGTPTATDREWRSVVVGGLREGGKGYYAIDVTQPDTLQTVTLNGSSTIIPNPSINDSNWVPECMGPYPVSTNCGPIPYGAPLWEFTDSSNDQILASGVVAPSPPVPMDESSGQDIEATSPQDLGAAWSTPNIGRIRICTGSDCTKNLEDRYVAVFGGGLDASNKTDLKNGAGRFLYIVDIETGHVLYKRIMPDPDPEHGRYSGAIPSEPAAVDTNQDGYFDRIYVGTTAGYLYRIDLGPDGSGNYPQLKKQTVTLSNGNSLDVMRIDPNFWQPRMIFDGTVDGVTGARVTRPIYYRPSVFFIAKLGTYGLAFGSGDREDLWTTDGTPGRFWLFVDDTDLSGLPLPYTEANFPTTQRIDVSTTTQLNTDLLVNSAPGHRGWYFVLGTNERLITPGFSLFGVMFFTSYAPLSYATTDPTCDPLNPPAGGCPQIVLSCSDKKQNVTGYCSKTGTSRLFVVNATNGNGLLPNSTTNSLDRYKAIAQFVTQPFTEPGQNKNAVPSTTTANADTLSADDIKVMNIIKGLFPKDCRFANYRIDVKTIASDTSVQRIAAVPMCIIERNWKEF